MLLTQQTLLHMGSLAERLVLVVTVGFEGKMEHTGSGCLSL